MSAKHTAKRAAFVFGQEMKACPACGGWHFMVQTPIKMEPIAATDTAKQLVGKWARATIAGAVMDGPVFIMCFDCGHKGPGVACEGRTRDEVGQDRALYTEVKRLWNEQTRKPQ